MNTAARDAGLKLLRQHALIAGKAIAANGKGIAVDDPATGEIIGHIPDLGVTETEQAIGAAHDAFADWSRSDPHKRARLRWRARRGLLENDIIVERFFNRYETELSDDDVAALSQLFELPDNDLMDLLLARKEPEGELDVPHIQHVLTLLRSV